MSAYKTTRGQQEDDGVPGMPGMDPEEGQDSSSQSISSSGESLGTDVISEDVAADILGLPFEAWAVFEHRIPKEDIVLSQRMKEFLGGPASRCFMKWGVGRLAKDEIILITALSLHSVSVIRAVSEAKQKEIRAQSES